MDAETKAVFTAIKDKLDNIGKETGETEEVKGLREQVNKLSEAIQQKEKEVLQGQISALNNQLNTMEARLEKKLAEAETKDEFSIMHTALKGAIDELKGVRGDLVTIFKAPPSPLSSGEKKKITQGISEDAQKEAALQTLEEQTFFG
jgi:flagellar capping protein FliD